MIANPMTKGETFDSFYTRKLDALKIQLKECIKGDIPYTVSAVYACTSCQGRIFLHTLEGQILCMRCIMPTSLMPSSWSKSVKTDVFRLMTTYPSLEASHCEYEALQSTPTPRELTGKAVPKTGNVELGRKIREARKVKGWTKDDLAKRIFKKNGQKIARSSIGGYEDGWTNPPQYILEQIKAVFAKEGIELEMEGWQNWNDVERDLKG